MYTTYYHSPLGNILLAADDIGLTGAWFEGQKYFASLPGFLINTTSGENHSHPLKNAILNDTIQWLDIYFTGKNPDFMPPLHPIGSDFQKEVWKILLEIPYGSTITYGDIAKGIAKQRGLKTMSAQAVGGAVGHNRISVIIPCHRVVGTNGSLTGYAGGIDRKIQLLKLEHADTNKFYVPKKGTAL